MHYQSQIVIEFSRWQDARNISPWICFGPEHRAFISRSCDICEINGMRTIYFCLYLFIYVFNSCICIRLYDNYMRIYAYIMYVCLCTYVDAVCMHIHIQKICEISLISILIESAEATGARWAGCWEDQRPPRPDLQIWIDGWHVGHG